MRIALVITLGLLIGLTGCRKNEKDVQMTISEPSAQPPAELPTTPDSSEPAYYDAAPPPIQSAVLPPPTQPSMSYTIIRGDTLWSIAVRELGNGQRWREISALNPGLNPNKLRVGQTITLPPR